MDAWWVVWPERLEVETRGLDQLGYNWQIIPGSQEEGCLKVSVAVPADGGTLNLEAIYPHTFPYFPPDVILRERSLRRHHHLVGKNLCLLEGEGRDWDPASDSLAVLLRDQLPILLEIERQGTGSDYAAEHEDLIAEPFSSFLSYAVGSSIIVPDDTPQPECKSGRLKFKGRKKVNDNEPLVRAVLTGFLSHKGEIQAGLPVHIPSLEECFSGYWVRLPGRPPDDVADNREHFLREAEKALPELKKELNKARKGATLIVGFVYDDEVAWRENGDDWIFMSITIKQQAKKSRPTQLNCDFVRADWGGSVAQSRRAPFLSRLRGKSVLIVGLGSLGSPLAIHLAKAGVGVMHMIDNDYLQMANSVRWALGARYTGLPKVLAMEDYIINEYPYTKPVGHRVRIGAAFPESPDVETLDSLCDEVDLIIDATANFRVNHYLSDLCKAKQSAYLWLTTTHGCQGGVVGRVVPGADQGCWHCLQYSLGDGTLRQPKDSGRESIQPGGCNQSTFIGAGLDSDEVSLLAARLAVATLCQGEQDAYADFEWNVAIGDFYSEQGPIAPGWTTSPLPRHPGCSQCNHEVFTLVD